MEYFRPISILKKQPYQNCDKENTLAILTNAIVAYDLDGDSSGINQQRSFECHYAKRIQFVAIDQMS